MNDDGYRRARFEWQLPVLLVVETSEYNRAGLVAGTVIVTRAEFGGVAAQFTDRDLAVEFVEDSGQTSWSVVAAGCEDLLTAAREWTNGGIRYVCFDAAYPGAHPERNGWFMPIADFVTQLEEWKRNHS